MNNDLISRSALLEFARNHIDGKIDCNDIARFPYANAEPVRYGRWVSEVIKKPDWKGRMRDYYQACSCQFCHKPDPGHGVSNYCPNCGAKMDAEVEGC